MLAANGEVSERVAVFEIICALWRSFRHSESVVEVEDNVSGVSRRVLYPSHIIRASARSIVEQFRTDVLSNSPMIFTLMLNNSPIIVRYKKLDNTVLRVVIDETKTSVQ
jgi:hypothetical protein